MLENYFICINPYLLTASVRNPTQKTVRKNKVNLSVQHNREGQFRINWLRESWCYQFSLSLRSLDAFLHVAGEIVTPQAYQLHNTRAESKRCFGWIKWEEFWLAQLWTWNHPSLSGWGVRSVWLARLGHMAFPVWDWGEVESALPKPLGRSSV